MYVQYPVMYIRKTCDIYVCILNLNLVMFIQYFVMRVQYLVEYILHLVMVIRMCSNCILDNMM